MRQTLHFADSITNCPPIAANSHLCSPDHDLSLVLHSAPPRVERAHKTTVQHVLHGLHGETILHEAVGLRHVKVAFAWIGSSDKAATVQVSKSSAYQRTFFAFMQLSWCASHVFQERPSSRLRR